MSGGFTGLVSPGAGCARLARPPLARPHPRRRGDHPVRHRPHGRNHGGRAPPGMLALAYKCARPPWMAHLVPLGSAGSLHWLPFVVIALHRRGSGSACEAASCVCIRSDHAVIDASWVSSQPPSPAGSAATAGEASSSSRGCGAASTRAAGGCDGPSSAAISVSSAGWRRRPRRVNTASPPSSASNSQVISHPNPRPSLPQVRLPRQTWRRGPPDLKAWPRYDIADTARSRLPSDSGRAFSWRGRPSWPTAYLRRDPLNVAWPGYPERCQNGHERGPGLITVSGRCAGRAPKSLDGTSLDPR
jgi:hypothetical protein